MGGPAMVTIHSDLKCAIAITNTAPFDIYLQRGAIIGLIKMEDINDNITALTKDNVKDIINSIAPVQLKSETLTHADIEKKQTSMFHPNSNQATLTFFSNTEKP